MSYRTAEEAFNEISKKLQDVAPLYALDALHQWSVALTTEVLNNLNMFSSRIAFPLTESDIVALKELLERTHTKIKYERILLVIYFLKKTRIEKVNADLVVECARICSFDGGNIPQQLRDLKNEQKYPEPFLNGDENNCYTLAPEGIKRVNYLMEDDETVLT
jgi:hypothetical protein